MELIQRIIRKCFGENVMHEFNIIKKNYYFSIKDVKGVRPIAIYSLDNRSFNHGFADRLRGMISIYAYAKAINVPFRIEHLDPFDLNTFYVPNKYNWNLKNGEKNFNLFRSNPIVLRNYTKGYRLPMLCKHRQHHFYTNIDMLSLINKRYHTNYNYTDLFKELFLPSQQLLDSVKDYCQYLQEGYISISFRFLQLMGDFKDIIGDTLDNNAQIELIKKCHDFIERIHQQNECKWILITSDSQKFMKSLTKFSYVFTLPGEIGHIGFSSSAETHLKTFMDFYMISQAQKAYMGYTGKMYKSHFAESAALTTGIQYEAINF